MSEAVPKINEKLEALIGPLKHLTTSIEEYTGGQSADASVTVSPVEATKQSTQEVAAAAQSVNVSNTGSAAPDATAQADAEKAAQVAAGSAQVAAGQEAQAASGSAVQAAQGAQEAQAASGSAQVAAGQGDQVAAGSAVQEAQGAQAAQSEEEKLKAAQGDQVASEKAAVQAASGSAPDATAQAAEADRLAEEEAKLKAQEAAPQAAYKLDMNLQFKTQNGEQISLERILNMLKNNKCQLPKPDCDTAVNEINNATSEQDVKNIIGKLKIFKNSIQSGGTRKPRMHRRKKTQRKRSKTIKKKNRAGNRK